jgi:CrcB protein
VPLIFVAAFGAIIGAGLRYALAQSVTSLESFWVTAGINLVGAFLIGLLSTQLTSELARIFVLTGLLGGFTTYSAIALDVTNLGLSLTTITYLVVTFVGGLVAALLGMRVKK